MFASAYSLLLLIGVLALPLAATAQRSYNNWVNPNSGLPVPTAAPGKPKPKPAVKASASTMSVTVVGGDSAAARKGYTLRVERVPIYPGGYEAMQQYIRKHLQRPKGSPRLSGPVKVTFTVLQNGTVTGAHVKPGNGLDARYDAAAVEVISGLKGFKAGERDGKPADIEITLPVEFR